VTDISQTSESAVTQNEAPGDAEGSAPVTSEPSQVNEPTAEAATEGGSDASLRDEVARLKDQLLRVAADFDNYRKRSRREIADTERIAREELLRELLRVFDNLDRAGQHASQASDVQSLADGIQMVLNQFTEVLQRLGVSRIEAVGQPFDPSVHEAVQQVETPEFPAGCIAAEVLAGYRYGERLVRPSMVVVAKAPSATPPAST